MPTLQPTAPWPSRPERPHDPSFAADPSRAARTARPRSGGSIPWPALAITLFALGALIALVLCQKAQLIAAQYQLVDLKTARTQQLKDRDELKLHIQRLTSLDRVDNLSRIHLKMIAPAERQVLDLSLHPTAANHTLMAQDNRSRHPDSPKVEHL